MVKEKSTIFSKNPTAYQKTVNAASFQMCKNDPSLLIRKKGDLLKLATQKVHDDGYCYKKGHSRSRRFEPVVGNESEPPPKQQKINADERQRRINDLCEEISSINHHINPPTPTIQSSSVHQDLQKVIFLSLQTSYKHRLRFIFVRRH